VAFMPLRRLQATHPPPRVVVSRYRRSSSGCASAFALRRYSRRGSDARIDAERIGAHRENSGAVSVAPLGPCGAIFSDEFEHALDGADSGGAALEMA
jgi:hypothetical protein